MDFLELLSVVAGYIETFFASISYLDALYLSGIVMAIGSTLLLGHVLLSGRAHASRAARSMSRYFENVYIGSCYEAQKFYKRKRHLMNRSARDEWSVFMRSSSPITNTDFVESVLARGRYSLGLVMGMHTVLMVVVESFLLMKGVLGGLSGMMLCVYAVVPVIIMGILHFVIYGAVETVNRCYTKNSRRLSRAVTYIDYNMYTHSYARSEERRQRASYLSPERRQNIDKYVTRLEDTYSDSAEPIEDTCDDVELDRLMESIEGTVPNM